MLIVQQDRGIPLQAPLITIGITSFNADDTINEAFESAVNQTWVNKEIIIVDDASTDETSKILKQLKLDYSDIQISLQSQNRGVAACRNEIIHLARGEFLAFFDDDDVSIPERIEKQYKRIIDYEKKICPNSYAICHAARTQKYPNGTSRYEHTMGINKGLAPNGTEVALRILTGEKGPNLFGSLATCSQMARLSLYRRLEGFDENFRRSEDTDFNVRAAMKGTHFIGIKEPLIIQNMTLSIDKKLSEEEYYALKLLDKHKDFLNGYNSYDFCCSWLKMKYKFLNKSMLCFFKKFIMIFLKHPILTIKKVIWALPNIKFNLTFQKFNNGQN